MTAIRKMYIKINEYIYKLDRAPLGFLYILIIGIIMSPIIYLGRGAVFPVVDQLDEVILNTVFTAKYFGQDNIAQMMCGIPASGLKPSSYFFLPLYKVFEPFTAFIIQYYFVVSTAFWGVYLVVKKVSKSSISAIVSASLFALLPFRSIYGNCLSGFPLCIFCYLLLLEHEKTKKRVRHFILPLLGLAYISLSSNLVLNGYATLITVIVGIVYRLLKTKRLPKEWLIGFGVQILIYLSVNIDLVLEQLAGSNVSHRVEFAKDYLDISFWQYFKDILLEGISHNESFHKYILIVCIAAIPFLIYKRNVRKLLLFPYLLTIACILSFAGMYALFSVDIVQQLTDKLGSFISSFQFNRFYYLLPGLWYILLGISIAIIVQGISKEQAIMGWLLALVLVLPTFFYVVKNEDSIFYMNINQKNNSNITGYITWEGFYSEDIMAQIETDIGEDMSQYRVASIGICPVVSLMHGFYTIDGYSNNYPLEYKHIIGEIQVAELALNDYTANYFYNWGSRCYLFYHEWGNGFLLGKNLNLQLNDFRFNIDKMKDLGCKYIFCAGEIIDYKNLGLHLLGYYSSEKSYWGIWVYRIC